MKQYLDLMNEVLTKGEDVPDRTGTGCRSLKGATLMFDLTRGFPLVTTRKMYTKQLVGELLAFIRGYDNAAGFRELGCRFWDANANEDKGWLDNPNRRGEDDLGRIYGAQWRNWLTHIPGEARHQRRDDQLRTLVNQLTTNPHDRRMIVTAWNPGELDRMALPPCHMFFQCGVENGGRELVLSMYQRSCDLFLGVPYNIASYALLTHLLAVACDLVPGRLIMNMFDVHLYRNHLEQAFEQVSREPLRRCNVEVPMRGTNQDPLAYLEALQPEHVLFNNYRYHPPIKAELAVE